MTGSTVLKVSKRDRWWDISSSIKISAFNCYSSMATATGFETDPLPHFYCSKFLRGRVVGWGSWWPMCGGPWRMKLNSLDDHWTSGRKSNATFCGLFLQERFLVASSENLGNQPWNHWWGRYGPIEHFKQICSLSSWFKRKKNPPLKSGSDTDVLHAE